MAYGGTKRQSANSDQIYGTGRSDLPTARFRVRIPVPDTCPGPIWREASPLDTAVHGSNGAASRRRRQSISRKQAAPGFDSALALRGKQSRRVRDIRHIDCTLRL